MKRFDNRTLEPKIDEAILIIERLLHPGSAMIKEIVVKNDWKYSSGTGLKIAESLIVGREKPLLIFTYRPLNPFTSAIGNFDGKAMHINSRKLPAMDIADLVENILHEFAHYLGYHHQDAGWLGAKRANFKTQEKCLYSLPYWLSENAKRFF